MSSSKRELVETLVALIDEDELRTIVGTVIEAQTRRLNKLQQLSLELSGGEITPSLYQSDGSEEDPGEETAGRAVLKILKDADRPLGNSDIRKRIYELYRKQIKPSTVGNVLWKGKKSGLFRKVPSSSGSRWTKWRYVER